MQVARGKDLKEFDIGPEFLTQIKMPSGGLMKRLSKSATDLSPCRKKSRSNSEDEEIPQQWASEPEGDASRPSSAQSSHSVPPYISLIGGKVSQTELPTTSDHVHISDIYRPHHVLHERSIAAEIEAVQKTANFSLFTMLRQKFSRGRISSRKLDVSQTIVTDITNIPVTQSQPEVIRYRCDPTTNNTNNNIAYQGDTESLGSSPSPIRKLPEVIRRKVVAVDGSINRPGIVRHNSSEDSASNSSQQAAMPTNERQIVKEDENPVAPVRKFNLRQDSRTSVLSLISRPKSNSVEADDIPTPDTICPPTSVSPPSKNESFHSVEDLVEECRQLVIHLKQGHDLAPRDSCGTSDPYVKFLVNNKLLHKSKTVNKDLNPFWDEHFSLNLEDISLPIDIKVYDYDWVMRDDFMGQASIQPSKLKTGQPTELVLTLVEAGQSEYLGQLSLEVTLLQSEPEHIQRDDGRRVSTASFMSGTSKNGVDLQAAARKLRGGNWAAVVTIVLVEGKELLALDPAGTSDPYCKFRLGNERYKSKTVYGSLNPEWLEQFDLYLYKEDLTGQEVEVTVWDKDPRSKDDFMGRCCIELQNLKQEVTHKMWLNLEDGAGHLFFLVTISGTTYPESSTFISHWDHSSRSLIKRKETYSLWNTLRSTEVGCLIVKVYRAKGLHAADMGGTSDPYCVLELDNTRLRTQTEYKTLDPVWAKVFQILVFDVHSNLEISVYDEDKNHKSEFLGKLCLPLLKIPSGDKQWYALKDKKLRGRAKGNFPQIQIGFELEWNIAKATFVTLNPKDKIFMQAVEKFNRQIFVNNVMRIKAVIMDILNFGIFINSCLEWESTPRSIMAFLIFITITYNFEPYMIPVGLLLIFLKHYLVTSYIEQRPLGSHQICSSDEDDDTAEKDEKDEKKSLKEKLQAIQDVTAMVQNALGYVASFCESIKNTFNFSVPFLSSLAIIILIVISIFLYFIPCRVIVLLWGINKFSRKLITPDYTTNNELMDFLSRVPDDEIILDSRELRLLHEESQSSKHKKRQRPS